MEIVSGRSVKDFAPDLDHYLVKEVPLFFFFFSRNSNAKS